MDTPCWFAVTRGPLVELAVKVGSLPNKSAWHLVIGIISDILGASSDSGHSRHHADASLFLYTLLGYWLLGIILIVTCKLYPALNILSFGLVL